MKVELSGITAVQAPVDRTTKQVSTPAHASSTSDSQGVTGDRTSFHAGSTSVQSLVGQALSAPALRQDKVDALRQAINSGTYKIDPARIGAALIAESK